ncbi:Inner membrane protein YiaW [Stieleria bergensis]|uniref:Inner membrane protein YiaW n=1 Tax=Stieleria bergensis TaxID=2528025 RepID=A0A517T1Q4_9BACT|nr:Inner membrane protein YiaW [Planctomycetes bacterium SV_7m_r]
MSIYDFIAFGAMLVVFCGLIFLVIWLGDLPANIATKRNHPQVDAVRVMSWLGLLFTGGILYLAAIIWAYYDYNAVNQQAENPSLKELESRVAQLEANLKQAEDHA